MAAEGVDSDELIDLADATESLEASSYSGPCKKQQPWGKVFTLILEDGPYITCTHTPRPHTFRL